MTTRTTTTTSTPTPTEELFPPGPIPPPNIFSSIGSLLALGIMILAAVLTLVYVCYRCVARRNDLKRKSAAFRGKSNKVAPVAIRQAPVLLPAVPSKASTATPPNHRRGPQTTKESSIHNAALQIKSSPPEFIMAASAHSPPPTTSTMDRLKSPVAKQQRQPSYDENELLNYFGGDEQLDPTVDFGQFQEVYATLRRPNTGDSTSSRAGLLLRGNQR